jgi:aminoacrylate hydrolase
MPRINIGDCTLYFERQGAGLPVLFISGLGGFSSYWRDQIPAFAKVFDTITYDHCGVGQSDRLNRPLTIEALTRDAIGLLDALDIQKAHIIGHSAGGAVAQVLAIEHPKRCEAVVIAASWAKADAYFRRQYALRKEILVRLGPAAYVQANSLFLYPSQYIARNHEQLRQMEAQLLATFAGADVVGARIDACLAFDRSNDLTRIENPTLVVVAQDDLVTPTYFSEELVRRIPGAEAKFFPQGGHYLSQTVARDFNHAVLPFLAAHTPGAGGDR